MNQMNPGKGCGWRRLRRFALAVSLMASLLSIIGGSTLAYLVAQSSEVVNVFEPVELGGEAEEQFNGKVKNNIKVHNKGEIPVYVRVKLQPLWVTMDEAETPVGKDPWEPAVYNDRTYWIYDEAERCYYYKNPLAAGELTQAIFPAGENDTSTGILMTKGDDGTKQQLIVMAQLIQSSPKEAVETVWPAVRVKANSTELELVPRQQEGSGE